MHIRLTIVAEAITLSALSDWALTGSSDDSTEATALASVSVTAADPLAFVVKVTGGNVVELSLDTLSTPH